jgi:valyl-tRNA synthetase
MDTNKYNEQQAELAIQKLWEQEHIYRFDPEQTTNQFTIDTPPPTISGKLHIGHIFSYTQTDLIARFRRMQGKNVFYPMGYDDNGLPTELYVEKKNSVSGRRMGRADFIKLCLKETADAHTTFKDIWMRMGLSINWEHTYSTISPEATRVSQYSFVDLYNKGHIYRKFEPALYCTSCQTTIAQILLESVEVETLFSTIIFKTTTGEGLLIATTRPELLASCVAVFYNPEDTRYQHLAGTCAISPIYGKQVPILPSTHVDIEKGTGLVMCCTFGDQTDILWFKEHKLPFIQSVGFDGRWTEITGPLAGLKVHDARAKILELLKEAGCITEQKKIMHRVQVDERCKKEIEYIVLNQWFIELLSHKEDFLKRADEIEWKPAFMKARYIDWVTNLSWDWCISRQRFFGVPFPVWHCQDCKHIIVADASMLPIDPQETSYPGKTCPKCSSTNLKGESDVMDTWATSASCPEINAHWPKNYPITLPMSMRPQAHDIIRTWAFGTIVKSHYHHGRIPWNEIVISGHALAGKGEKFSKSKGNALLDPINLMATYSSDAIRYWAASGKLGTDILFNEDQLKIGRRLVTKLWNAFKFNQEHVVGAACTIENLNAQDPLNYWLMQNLCTTYQEFVKAFDAYDYHHALEVTEKFLWNIYCDNYLELVKHRFFKPENHSAELLKETKQTMYVVGLHMLKMFAPVIPHVTDSLYQEMFRPFEKTASIHNHTWQEAKLTGYVVNTTTETIDAVVTAVGAVRKLKSEHALSLKTPLKKLTVVVAEDKKAWFEQVHKTIIAGVSQAESVEFATLAQESYLTESADGWMALVKI